MVITWRKSLFALLWFVLSSQAWAYEQVDVAWDLSVEEKAKIQHGDIIVHKKVLGEQKEIHAFLWIHAPPEQLLSTITDYQTLPEFMPHLEATKVLHQDEKGALVNYILALPFGVSKRYRLQLTYDTTPPDLAMRWQKVAWEGLNPDETIADSAGYWFFKKAENNTTMLHYYTSTNPGHVPFGLGWIVDYLTEETVVDLLKNTQTRAEQQWQKRQH